MSEIISSYHLDNIHESIPVDRKSFYDEEIEEFKKNGKPSRAVGLVQVLLFTEHKEIILQKRSSTKRHNPNLVDKTVGGHIPHGDSPYIMATVECMQELRVPTVVLREDEDFVGTFEKLKTTLDHIAVLKCVDQQLFQIENIYEGVGNVMIAKNIWMFFGVYSGAVKPVDAEASGILFYKLDTLESEMQKTPELFTPDLHFFLKTYKDDIRSFLEQV